MRIVMSPAISVSHSAIVRTACATSRPVSQSRPMKRSIAGAARAGRARAAAGSARRRRNTETAGRGRSRRRRPARSRRGAPMSAQRPRSTRSTSRDCAPAGDAARGLRRTRRESLRARRPVRASSAPPTRPPAGGSAVASVAATALRIQAATASGGGGAPADTVSTS